MNGTWGTVHMNRTLALTLMNQAKISRTHLTGSPLKSDLIQAKMLVIVDIGEPERRVTIYRLVTPEARAVL